MLVLETSGAEDDIGRTGGGGAGPRDGVVDGSGSRGLGSRDGGVSYIAILVPGQSLGNRHFGVGRGAKREEGRGERGESRN